MPLLGRDGVQPRTHRTIADCKVAARLSDCKDVLIFIIATVRSVLMRRRRLYASAVSGHQRELRHLYLTGFWVRHHDPFGEDVVVAIGSFLHIADAGQKSTRERGRRSCRPKFCGTATGRYSHDSHRTAPTDMPDANAKAVR